MRSFVAIEMPAPVVRDLARLQAAIPVGRIVAPENLHLTLTFLGDQSEAMLEEVHFALETLRLNAFDLTLSGLATFGDPPLSLHAGVEASPALIDLQSRVRSRLHGIGLPGERRRFAPHVTLARFGKGATPDEVGRLGRFLAAHGDLRLPPARITGFGLYESILTEEGPYYELLASYPLG